MEVTLKRVLSSADTKKINLRHTTGILNGSLPTGPREKNDRILVIQRFPARRKTTGRSRESASSDTDAPEEASNSVRSE